MDEPSTTCDKKRKSSDTKHRKRPTKKQAQCPKEPTTPGSSCGQGDVEWPELFKEVEKLHRALNTIFTFCSARKHMPTTFDIIKSTVEANLRRPITIAEVAQVVAIQPERFQFEYVNETMLRPLDLDPFVARLGAAENASRGRWIRADGADKDYLDRKPVLAPGEATYVLYFEFVDTPAKEKSEMTIDHEAVSGSSSSSAARPQRRLKDDGKPGTMNHKHLAKLISRRNELFTKAVNIFIDKQTRQGDDPVEALQRESRNYIPRPPEPATLEPKSEYQDTIPAKIPTDRNSFAEIIRELKASSWYLDQIMPDGHFTTMPKEPEYGDLEFLLSQTLVDAIYNARGITQFYSHQAQALNALHSGHNVVVSTSTSSGKSLIYQLPVLYDLEKDLETRAFYIFPTKALAQDQRKSLAQTLSFMAGLEHTVVDTFDGDTARHVRDDIRENANVIFTNPDMLHVSILPQHQSWGHVLKHLRYVVVDELHYYDGQMGAHMAFIMRRLRRICALHGNTSVKFISCSATVSNPVQHFQRIFGLCDVTLVSQDGSPEPLRHHLLWNTASPALAAAGAEDPSHVLGEVARVFCALLLRGVRLLVFCKMRSQCEQLLNAVQNELMNLGRAECMALVMGYRGGYMVQDRRRIEADMFSGRLRGIIATSALELGVDMGSLDCVISWGFPHSLANLRQQFGRAGRRAHSGMDALAILVGDRTAEDQHYMENAAELQMPVTAELWSDLGNREIFEGHLNCAAFEEPVDIAGDIVYFGKDLPVVLASSPVDGDWDRNGNKDREDKEDKACGCPCPRPCPLAEDGKVRGKFHPRQVFWPYPAKRVSIRAIEEDMVSVVDLTNGRFVVLEEMELSRATFALFAGAVYLHQGQAYTVKEYNAKERIAKVEYVKTR
ncbi:ATP-dependent helicase hrq1 [Ceratocystis fimbriata CBS 114723]|uniref:ATP-dependent helicase hrq1 n=1 Tax=Ceratocystis fimbriata CBS 114723 TaxID=1035309 RepID=A0A2C5WV53_9PEZI|nr:ATP-dependent helicase hrq1 [Ceratocystis fimbriata CBS 114723]